MEPIEIAKAYIRDKHPMDECNRIKLARAYIRYAGIMADIAAALGCPDAEPGELAGMVESYIEVSNAQIELRHNIIVSREKERDEAIAIISDAREYIGCHENQSIKMRFGSLRDTMQGLENNYRHSKLLSEELCVERDRLMEVLEQISVVELLNLPGAVACVGIVEMARAALAKVKGVE